MAEQVGKQEKDQREQAERHGDESRERDNEVLRARLDTPVFRELKEGLPHGIVNGKMFWYAEGDLALRRTIQREYDFGHLPTDEELVELSDHWRPYRSLAVSYLFASGYAENP